MTLPAGLALRNPDVFSSPLQFDPSRYEHGREEHKKSGGVFFAFGAGTHPCPGRPFANFEMSILAAEALRHFEWKIVEQGPSDDFTTSAIDISNHPRLDPSQAGFLWRPSDPILVECRRRERE